MATRRTSLALKHRRWDVPLLLIVSAGLLAVGLSLPVLETKSLIFWKSEYSIWAGVVNLWRDEHYGLAVILLLFSIVFPVAKLLALAALWLLPLPFDSRRDFLHRIKFLGKWSMLDVFVVAIVVVVTQSGGLVDVRPRAGVYVFASAIALSMIVTLMVERAAKR